MEEMGRTLVKSTVKFPHPLHARTKMVDAVSCWMTQSSPEAKTQDIVRVTTCTCQRPVSEHFSSSYSICNSSCLQKCFVFLSFIVCFNWMTVLHGLHLILQVCSGLPSCFLCSHHITFKHKDRESLLVTVRDKIKGRTENPVQIILLKVGAERPCSQPTCPPVLPGVSLQKDFFSAGLEAPPQLRVLQVDAQ